MSLFPYKLDLTIKKGIFFIMNYNDIEITLTRFKNYQIPATPKIMTNHIIRNPHHYERFLDKSKHIDDLLSFIHESFDELTHYGEDALLKIILEYFGLESKVEIV